MICHTNKSRVAKKLHIYFNFISFQEIFIEHLLPDTVLGTECANRNKTIPSRNDQSGSAQEKEITLGILSMGRFNAGNLILENPGKCQRSDSLSTSEGRPSPLTGGTRNPLSPHCHLDTLLTLEEWRMHGKCCCTKASLVSALDNKDREMTSASLVPSRVFLRAVNTQS